MTEERERVRETDRLGVLGGEAKNYGTKRGDDLTSPKQIGSIQHSTSAGVIKQASGGMGLGIGPQ